MVLGRIFQRTPEAIVWSVLFVSMVYLSSLVPLVGAFLFFFIPVVPALHTIRLSPYSAMFWNTLALVLLSTQMDGITLLLATYHLCAGIGAGTGLLQMCVMALARFVLKREEPGYQPEPDLLAFTRSFQIDSYFAAIAGSMIGAALLVGCWPYVVNTNIAVWLENAAVEAIKYVELLGAESGFALLTQEAQSMVLHTVHDLLHSNLTFCVVLGAVLSAHLAYHFAYWLLPLIGAFAPPRVRLRYSRLPRGVLHVLMFSMLALFFFRNTATAFGSKRWMRFELSLGFTALSMA